VSGVLRQFIIDDFSDRAVLGLCESLRGVELEKNLKRFARKLDSEKNEIQCEKAINELIKVYQTGKSLRNRIVHELSSSLWENKMHLHKHIFNPDHSSKQLVLNGEILDKLVKWMSAASEYSAEVGIELSFIRGLRPEKQREFIPNNHVGWPKPLDLLTWTNLEGLDSS
jgi:hypothetical protein